MQKFCSVVFHGISAFGARGSLRARNWMDQRIGGGDVLGALVRSEGFGDESASELGELEGAEYVGRQRHHSVCACLGGCVDGGKRSLVSRFPVHSRAIRGFRYRDHAWSEREE